MRFGRVSGSAGENGWKWEISSSDSLWLWLNVSGDGLLWGPRDRFFLRPGMHAITGGNAAGAWSCVRHAGFHRLEVIRLSRQWLDARLGNHNSRHGISDWLAADETVAFCGLMGVWEKDLCGALEAAFSHGGGSKLLAEARLLEWAAHRLMRAEPTEKSATGREPVKRALALLRSQLDQPLDLTALAREIGISPHHLSRQVSHDTGLTLLRHLRRMRVEHACEALATGKMNVTEVSLETGYQSLSHFAKAFRQETGASPSEWLAQRRAG